MSDDLYSLPPRGILDKREIQQRAEARMTEIDALAESGASDDVTAAKVADAIAAHEADKTAFAARKMDQRDVVNGFGAPPREVVEGSLGTPLGDDHATHWGLDIGDFSVEQIQAMHRNGMSFAEIGKRAMARRRTVR